MPDAPAPITTGIRPPLGRRAANRSSMPCTASAAISSRSPSVSISAPARKLRETVLFSVFPPCWKMAVTETVPIGRVSYLSSFKELYISTSVTCQASIAMIFTMRLSRAWTACSSRFMKGMRADASVERQWLPTG